MAVTKCRVLLDSYEKNQYVYVDSNLFRCEDGSPFSFKIVPCVERRRIRSMIVAGGGRVDEEDGPYTITLVPPSMAAYIGDDEAFGYDYIYQCCEKNKLLDLKLYRIGIDSRKYQDYNPLDVLQQRLKWDDIPLLVTQFIKIENTDQAGPSTPVTPEKKNIIDTNAERLNKSTYFTSGTVEIVNPRDIDKKLKQLISTSKQVCRHSEPLLAEEEIPGKSFEEPTARLTPKTENTELVEHSTDDESDSSINVVDIPTSPVLTIPSPVKVEKFLRPVKSRRTASRRDYREDERKKIIQYIRERGAYDQVKGTKMWMELESADIVEGRTWQSMKEHYIKKIIPNIKYYNLPKDVLERFRQPFRK